MHLSETSRYSYFGSCLTFVKRTAQIRLRDDLIEVVFNWRDFDGDDCFSCFQMTVDDGIEIRRFDLGTSIVWALRRFTRFFESCVETTLGAGSLEVHRSGNHYHIAIISGDLRHEFHVYAPVIEIDREFLNAYDR